jgi:hypothetical protein
MAFPGAAGSDGTAGPGTGGGLWLNSGGTATIADTSVTGNHASTSNNDTFPS